MANINDLLLIGLGGAGGRLVDDMVEYNPLYQQFYINTSITDLESLNNLNKITNNYYCLGMSNGVGRNRKLGKTLAEQYGYNMMDIIQRTQQKVLYLVSSLGGGSGNSILSVLLNALDELKEDGDFDKTVNLILILPYLNSHTIILENAKTAWNELISHKSVNSIIFISNNSKNGNESAINNEFCETFDSLFDIPDDNGILFDNMNLQNIMNDKGVLYFFNLENDCSSIEVAFEKAKKESVLAPMFFNELNLKTNKDGSTYVKCGYLGLSFSNNKYNKDYLINKFDSKYETYVGNNSNDNNLVLISGMIPPYESITLIEHELETRESQKESDDIDFSKFTVKSKDKQIDNKIKYEEIDHQEEPKSKKKKLKKGLFKR